MLCFKFLAFSKPMDVIYYYLSQTKTFLKFKKCGNLSSTVYKTFNILG